MMYKIRENAQYNHLEGSKSIMQAKCKNPIGKGRPLIGESCDILIFRTDLDVIVLVESI